MADKHASNRRPPSDERTSRRLPHDQPSGRGGMIHCDKCGEDYSATYRRCPFCDERAGRVGRRQSNQRGGGYSNVSPLHVATVVISLVIIIAAIYIVFSKFIPFLTGGKVKPVNPGPGTSQVDPSGSGDGSISLPDPSGSGTDKPDTPDKPDKPNTPNTPVEPQKPDASKVTSITLDKTDMTLDHGKSYTLKATVAPSGAGQKVTWSSSNPDALTVDADGKVTNNHTGSDKLKVTVTAACGDKTATCTVYCRPGSGAKPQPDSKPTGGKVKPNTPATIINAGDGLNIRSGPGKTHDVVASATNGAKIIVKEDAGNGWYKIDYGNGQLGYVSSDFVKIG